MSTGKKRMSRTDTSIRVFGYLAVLAVAIVAGYLSYWDITSVVALHAGIGTRAHLYAAIIDGTLLASSAVLIDHARHKVKAPKVAWLMTFLGAGSTFAFNVAAGLPHGWEGAVIAGMVSVMLLGTTELMLLLVKGAGRETVPVIETVPETVPVDVPQDVTVGVLDTVLQTVPVVESVMVPSTPAPVLESVPEIELASTVDTAPEHTEETVPERVSEHVSPRVPKPRAKRAPSTKPGTAKRAPEHVFAEDLSAGRLPSLRAVKAQMGVGTDKARAIRADLASMSGQEVLVDA